MIFGVGAARLNRLREMRRFRVEREGHEFTHADKSLKMRAGFSACGMLLAVLMSFSAACKAVPFPSLLLL